MPRVIRVERDDADSTSLSEAADMLRDGLVVAFPTDTFYGLAVDPRNAGAVRRLYALKHRAETAALILIAADAAQAELAGSFSDVARRLAQRWWPGPLTIVTDAKPAIVAEALGGRRTVGVRVPDRAIARELARRLGFSVTATSANRSGEPPASRAEDVIAMLPELDAVIDEGATPGGAPSTIVDAAADGVRLVREGAVAWDRVLKSLG
jgi:L-threonylcarbamoyladenylate synthase